MRKMKMNNDYIFYTLLISLFVSVSSCSLPTPHERFQDKYISTNYNYKAEEDTNYLQALDSGWMSQEIFELICDLQLNEKTYGKTISKAQYILDSASICSTALGFPFSLPDYCNKKQIDSFMKYDGEVWSLPNRVRPDRWEIDGPWDTLLIKYEPVGVQKNDVYYSDFSYSIFNDTILRMSMQVKKPIHELMTLKFGKFALYREEKEKPYISYEKDTSFTNNFYYTWVDDNFVIELHEYEYQHRYNKQYKYYLGVPNIHAQTSTITYTNRDILHSYRNAVKQSKLQYAEEQRIKREQEKIKEMQRQQEQQEKHRQDSARRAAGAILNL